MPTGVIVDVKHFAVHDGDGIRTTVFLKGCPLKCVWCHNPEGISFSPQLSYIAKKCIGCGACVEVCAAGAHRISDAGHEFLREKCISCGACADACLGEALKLYGKKIEAEDLLPELLEDVPFYESSGGGVTLSGGEALMQPAFCAALLRRLKENGVSTAVDTCGDVPRAAVDAVFPFTDVFLYDIKAIDPEVHRKCTGRTNERILENIRMIDERGGKIEVRYPYVPGMNDGECEKIAAFLKTLRRPVNVRVLPYHSFAGSKYEALGMENTLPGKAMPDEETMRRARETFRRAGITVLE